MIRPIVLVTFAGLLLAGCGKVGTLDQPAPLWGENAKAKYQAQKAEAARAKVAKDEATPPETLPDGRSYDPKLDPGPMPNVGMPGQTTPEPGVLPNPVNPQR
jgi:uncharacterized protein YceK